MRAVRRWPAGGAVVLLGILAGAGCGRTESKLTVEPKRVEAPAQKSAVADPTGAALPDYSAQAKADVKREQAAELQARVEQVKVELPARKK